MNPFTIGGLLVTTAWFMLLLVVDPRFRITVKRADDQVELVESNKQSVFTVTSPSGIGSVTIARPAGGWPADHALILQLKLKGLEELRVTAGDCHWVVAVSSSDRQSHIRLKLAGKETEVTDRKDRYWTQVRTTPCYEMKLPPALTSDNPETLTIHWIDFFR